MRISIIGYPGSGKTYLAELISRKLSVPHIHIDRFWFEAGGMKISRASSEADRERVRAEVREKALEAITAKSWVSDGFYSRIQPEIAERADIVLYLDIPLWRRLLNHAKRICDPSHRHEELTMWNEFGFFFEIIRQHFAFRSKFKKFLDAYGYKVIVLRSRKDIADYIATLGFTEVERR